MYTARALPELLKVTGLTYLQLSKQMLELNLLLIRSAPLTYVHEVVSSFSTYWLPASGILANLNSRYVQLIWSTLHFAVIGVFVFYMTLLTGAGIYLQKLGKTAVWDQNDVNRESVNRLHLQSLLYIVAGAIIFYTAVISCFLEVGDPRYRVPTDGLILAMTILGIDIWHRLITVSTLRLSILQSPKT
jgi:hypothetical protein